MGCKSTLIQTGKGEPVKLRMSAGKNGVDCVIPASTFQNDSYAPERYFFLKTGRATPHNQLAGGYCKQSGKDLYDFLVQYTPAGIYEQLVRLIISRDITCDNYCAEILGMDKAEVRNKAKAVELSNH